MCRLVGIDQIILSIISVTVQHKMPSFRTASDINYFKFTGYIRTENLNKKTGPIFRLNLGYLLKGILSRYIRNKTVQKIRSEHEFSWTFCQQQEYD